MYRGAPVCFMAAMIFFMANIDLEKNAMAGITLSYGRYSTTTDCYLIVRAAPFRCVRERSREMNGLSPA
jgi:hypothetical protein